MNISTKKRKSDVHIFKQDVPPKNFLKDSSIGEDFYTVISKCKLEGFSFHFLTVYKGTKRVAAVPYFLAHFNLGTMVTFKPLKKLLDLVSFSIACAGNPMLDFCMIEGEISKEVIDFINRELFKSSDLIAYKNFSDSLPLTGFTKVKALPVTKLKLTPDYWNDMNSERRSNLKKKYKKIEHIRMEECVNLDDELASSVYSLYLNTYNKSDVRFEKLTKEYFVNMMPHCNLLLAYHGDTLVGFSQLFKKGDRLTFGYLGLDYDISHKYGVYFILFLQTIEIGLRDGIREIDFGATTYTFKHKLGCSLTETCIYYRHRNSRINWFLSLLAVFVEPSKKDLL